MPSARLVKNFVTIRDIKAFWEGPLTINIDEINSDEIKTCSAY